MKKTLLTIGVVAALFSCSKEDEVTVLEATDMTATTVVAGKTTYEHPTTGNMISLPGAVVTVTVNNSDLYGLTIDNQTFFANSPVKKSHK